MAKHEVLMMPNVVIPNVVIPQKMEIKIGNFKFTYLNIFLLLVILIIIGYIVFKLRETY